MVISENWRERSMLKALLALGWQSVVGFIHDMAKDIQK